MNKEQIQQIIADVIEKSSKLPSDDTFIKDLHDFLTAIGYKFKQDKATIWTYDAQHARAEFAMPKDYNSFRTETKDKLLELYSYTRFSYEDLFVCSNKLVKRRKYADNNKVWTSVRAQSHIDAIEYIVLESDNESLEKQYQLFLALKPYVASLVYSGNKSLHITVKIPKIKTCIEHFKTTHAKILAHIDYYMQLNDMSYDIGVAKDYSKLTRIPNTIHSKSKKLSILMYTNDNAAVFDATKQFYIKNKEDFKVAETIEREYIELRVNNHVHFLNESAPEPVKPINKRTADWIVSIPNYADNLDNYYRFMEYGMQDKQTRRRMYRDVIVANRILTGYDFNQIQLDSKIEREYIELRVNNHVHFLNKCLEDVTQILELSEGRYQCSFEYAIEDFNRFFKKTIIMKANIKLPNLTTIQASELYSIKQIKHNLKSIGFAQPNYLAKTIINLLMPKIKELPYQCKNGTLGLHADKELRTIIHRSEYVATIESLKHNKIMIKTHNYKVNEFNPKANQTNKFWLNIPLILYIATNAKELDWSQYKSIRTT